MKEYNKDYFRIFGGENYKEGWCSYPPGTTFDYVYNKTNYKTL